MTTKLLLPNRYKTIGWFILVPATILGLILCYYGFDADWLGAVVFAIATDKTFGSNKFLLYLCQYYQHSSRRTLYHWCYAGRLFKGKI